MGLNVERLDNTQPCVNYLPFPARSQRGSLRIASMHQELSYHVTAVIANQSSHMTWMPASASLFLELLKGQEAVSAKGLSLDLQSAQKP